MIIGIGTDLVNCARIAATILRFENRFKARVFTDLERQHAEAKADRNTQIARFAKAFAAKEAVGKALGTGLSRGVSWQDIELGHDAIGKPKITLTGGAAVRLEDLTPAGRRSEIHISLSDENPMALAFVIIYCSLSG